MISKASEPKFSRYGNVYQEEKGNRKKVAPASIGCDVVSDSADPISEGPLEIHLQTAGRQAWGTPGFIGSTCITVFYKWRY